MGRRGLFSFVRLFSFPASIFPQRCFSNNSLLIYTGCNKYIKMHPFFVDLDFNDYWQVFVFIKGQPVMGNSCLNLYSDILEIKV